MDTRHHAKTLLQGSAEGPALLQVSPFQARGGAREIRHKTCVYEGLAGT